MKWTFIVVFAVAMLLSSCSVRVADNHYCRPSHHDHGSSHHGGGAYHGGGHQRPMCR